MIAHPSRHGPSTAIGNDATHDGARIDLIKRPRGQGCGRFPVDVRPRPPSVAATATYQSESRIQIVAPQTATNQQMATNRESQISASSRFIGAASWCWFGRKCGGGADALPQHLHPVSLLHAKELGFAAKSDGFQAPRTCVQRGIVAERLPIVFGSRRRSDRSVTRCRYCRAIRWDAD